ncbi:hypothetical protein F5B20DRAFT_179185 [Whalleya microplaca]|nr:hypothetical protein F5B20DRAFT_179185 [Whalleya microplaca]
MASTLASAPYRPPPTGSVYPRPTEQSEGGTSNKRKIWWFSSSSELKARDGWFKTPRNTTWTIDSTVDGKPKPSGYDSNSLITIIRAAQCVTAIAVLILYVFTLSAPSPWLLALAAILGVLTGAWSIFALFLRHIWSIWLAVPEILLMIAWVVLFIASAAATPEDSKAMIFKVATLVTEASMVLMIPTGLLAATPAFHKCMPWLFHGKARDGGSEQPDEAMSTGIEMPTMPPNAYMAPTTPAVYSNTPPLASPRPKPPPISIPPTSHWQIPRRMVSTRANGSRAATPYHLPTSFHTITPTEPAQQNHPPMPGHGSPRPMSPQSIPRSVSTVSAVTAATRLEEPVSPLTPTNEDPMPGGFTDRPHSPPSNPYARR